VSSHAFELLTCSCCEVVVDDADVVNAIDEETLLNKELDGYCSFHIFRGREKDACDREDRKKTRPKDMGQAKENDSSSTGLDVEGTALFVELVVT